MKGVNFMMSYFVARRFFFAKNEKDKKSLFRKQFEVLDSYNLNCTFITFFNNGRY